MVKDTQQMQTSSLHTFATPVLCTFSNGTRANMALCTFCTLLVRWNLAFCLLSSFFLLFLFLLASAFFLLLLLSSCLFLLLASCLLPSASFFLSSCLLASASCSPASNFLFLPLASLTAFLFFFLPPSSLLAPSTLQACHCNTICIRFSLFFLSCCVFFFQLVATKEDCPNSNCTSSPWNPRF